MAHTGETLYNLLDKMSRQFNSYDALMAAAAAETGLSVDTINVMVIAYEEDITEDEVRAIHANIAA